MTKDTREITISWKQTKELIKNIIYWEVDLNKYWFQIVVISLLIFILIAVMFG